MLFVLPELSFQLFDDIFSAFKNGLKLTQAQLFTYFHAVRRCVDVLALLPTRYLDNDQVHVLSSIAIMGMLSPYPKIRGASYRVARVLGAFEADEQSGFLLNFIKDNERAWSQQLFARFEGMADRNRPRLAPLSFVDAMETDDPSLWQMILSSFGMSAMDHFSDSFRLDEKRQGTAAIKD
jgi:hypothetical protein